MTTAIETRWDQADVAILADAEAETRRYIETLKRAAAAGRRLEEAGYAGADPINEDDLGVNPQGTQGDTSIQIILRHLELAREGGGDLGQYVFHNAGIDLEQDLGEQLQEASKNYDEPWVTALYGYLFAKGLLPIPAGANA